MVHPGVEAEAERGKAGETFAHTLVHQQPLWPGDHRSPRRLVGMRGGDEADAAKAAAAGRNHRIQDLLDRRAEHQVGIADDTRADLRLAVGPARRHRPDAVGEFDFANRAQFGGSCCAVHRKPFEVHGRGDVVSGAEIGEQFRQQIAAGLRPVDQVMVRIDDREVGLDDLFAAPVEPLLPDRQVQPEHRRSCRGLHRRPPPS